MYQELLEIVRSGDDEDESGTSTDATRPDSYSNMGVIVEESEPEFPSFSAKKKPGLLRGDSEFD